MSGSETTGLLAAMSGTPALVAVIGAAKKTGPNLMAEGATQGQLLELQEQWCRA